jgi:predicted small lipoprotein YifL
MRGLALLLLILAGCGAIGPYGRPGVWRPAQVNEANLQQMLAEPGQRAWGEAARGTDGAIAAAAVERLRDGKPRPLPEITLGRSGGSGN